jgi:cysteine desulfurase/selenocysteine lyase
VQQQAALRVASTARHSCVRCDTVLLGAELRGPSAYELVVARTMAAPPTPEPAAAPTLVSPQQMSLWRTGLPGEGGWMHLNAAGASPSPLAAHRAHVEHLELERQMGGYQAEAAAGACAAAREAVARLLGCAADEVALCASAQAAWSAALMGLKLGPSDRIVLCGESEYAGNVVGALQKQQQCGCGLEVLACHQGSSTGLQQQHAVVDLGAVRAALSAATPESTTVLCLCHVRMRSCCRVSMLLARRAKQSKCAHAPTSLAVRVGVPQVNTSSAVVQDAAAVGALVAAARRESPQRSVIYVLDACQSLGQLPVHVREWSVDFACGTGRKWLRGPRGTGFLFARSGSESLGSPPLLDHSSARWAGGDSRTFTAERSARRFELWEHNIAGCAGLAAAVDVALSVGIEVVAARTLALATRLRHGLAALDGVTICDGSSSSSGAPPAQLACDRSADGRLRGESAQSSEHGKEGQRTLVHLPSVSALRHDDDTLVGRCRRLTLGGLAGQVMVQSGRLESCATVRSCSFMPTLPCPLLRSSSGWRASTASPSASATQVGRWLIWLILYASLTEIHLHFHSMSTASDPLRPPPQLRTRWRRTALRRVS